MTLVVLIVYVATTAWIGYDANRRDWSDHSFADRPWKWVVGSLLLWVVVVPVYLFQRGRVPVRA